MIDFSESGGLLRKFIISFVPLLVSLFFINKKEQKESLNGVDIILNQIARIFVKEIEVNEEIVLNAFENEIRQVF